MKKKDYLLENIIWKNTSNAQRPYAAEIKGKKYELRVNDFPEEHLYTLIIDGAEITDFDDWSASWKRPAELTAQKAATKSATTSAKASTRTASSTRSFAVKAKSASRAVSKKS